MSHSTAIGGSRATCTCGWTHESDHLSTLQIAAYHHELEPPEPEPAQDADPLEALAVAATSLTGAERQAQEWRDKRDALVVEAMNAGTPIAHIARAAGISRQTVYEIARRQ